MRGHASLEPHTVLCQGRGRRKFQFVSLAKSLEFQKIIESFLRDKRFTGLTSLWGMWVWVQALDVLKMFLDFPRISLFWLNSPRLEVISHYNEVFPLSTQVLANVHTPVCVGPGRPSSDAPSSYGFTEVLDQLWRLSFPMSLLSTCRIFHRCPAPRTQAWPCNHWWYCFLHPSPQTEELAKSSGDEAGLNRWKVAGQGKLGIIRWSKLGSTEDGMEGQAGHLLLVGKFALGCNSFTP